MSHCLTARLLSEFDSTLTPLKLLGTAGEVFVRELAEALDVSWPLQDLDVTSSASGDVVDTLHALLEAQAAGVCTVNLRWWERTAQLERRSALPWFGAWDMSLTRLNA